MPDETLQIALASMGIYVFATDVHVGRAALPGRRAGRRSSGHTTSARTIIPGMLNRYGRVFAYPFR